MTTPPDRPRDEPPVLPPDGSDDGDVGWGERPPEEDGVEHYLRERPPHHGD